MDEPTQESIEEKNELIGRQLVSLIQSMHQDIRPFVLIFPSPEDEGMLQSFTNIKNMRKLRSILRQHLQMAKDAEEMVTVPTASVVH